LSNAAETSFGVIMYKFTDYYDTNLQSWRA